MSPRFLSAATSRGRDPSRFSDTLLAKHPANTGKHVRTTSNHRRSDVGSRMLLTDGGIPAVAEIDTQVAPPDGAATLYLIGGSK